MRSLSWFQCSCSSKKKQQNSDPGSTGPLSIKLWSTLRSRWTEGKYNILSMRSLSWFQCSCSSKKKQQNSDPGSTGPLSIKLWSTLRSRWTEGKYNISSMRNHNSSQCILNSRIIYKNVRRAEKVNILAMCRQI